MDRLDKKLLRSDPGRAACAQAWVDGMIQRKIAQAFGYKTSATICLAIRRFVLNYGRGGYDRRHACIYALANYRAALEGEAEAIRRWKSQGEYARGYVLTGGRAHYCETWGGAPVDDTTKEIKTCRCFGPERPNPMSVIPGTADARRINAPDQ